MLTDFSVFVYHDLDRYFSGKRKLQNTEDSDESIDEEGNQFLDSCEVDSDVSECSEKQNLKDIENDEKQFHRDFVDNEEPSEGVDRSMYHRIDQQMEDEDLHNLFSIRIKESFQNEGEDGIYFDPSHGNKDHDDDSTSDDEGSSDSNRGDDSDDEVNPMKFSKKNLNYVIYSDTESDNCDCEGEGLNQMIEKENRPKQVRKPKLINSLSKKRKSKKRYPNIFSSKCVFSTSVHNYSDTKYKLVPLNKENLCLFTALAKFKFPKQLRLTKISKKLFLEWKKKQNKTVFDWSAFSISDISIKGYNKAHKGFRGIRESELLSFEEYFGVRLHFFTKEYILCDDNGGKIYTRLIRRSDINSGPVMNLHVDSLGEHVDLILSMSSYGNCFICKRCEFPFSHKPNLIRHENTCIGTVRKRYIGGPYHPPKTIFQQLELYGIFVPKDLRYHKYRTVFDFETFLKKTQFYHKTYSYHHIPYSYGCATNAPGAKELEIQINEDPLELVRGFIHYLTKVSNIISKINSELYSPYLDQIRAKLSEVEKLNKVVEIKALEKLCSGLELFINQSIAVGFNSSRFDVPAIRSYMFQVFKQMGSYGDDPTQFYVDNPELVVKNIHFIERGTQVLSLQCDKWKLLDIVNFMAPGCPYEKYVSTWCPLGVSLSKSHFPHEIMKDHIKHLENRTFPTYDEFYSSLKQKNLFSSVEEYNLLRDRWTDETRVYFKDDHTLRSLLIEYQENDTLPFLKCLSAHVDMYKNDLGLDLLAFNITLPSLSWRWAFIPLNSSGTDPVFYNFPESFATVHDEILNGRTGGATLLFRREAKRGDYIDSRICASCGKLLNYNDIDQVCEECEINKIQVTHNDFQSQCVEKIVSYDCNALYPYQFLKPQLTGPAIYREAPDFRAERVYHGVRGASISAYEWLQYIKEKNKYKIMFTKFNTGEVKITNRSLPVDGFTPATETRELIAFNFFGCFFHGCVKAQCRYGLVERKIRNIQDSKKREEARKKLIIENDLKYADTMELIRYIREQGIQLVCKWECDWKREKKSDYVQQILTRIKSVNLYPETEGTKSSMTEDQICSKIKDGSFFGVIKCDIEVPHDKRKYFEIFPPLFKKASVTIDDVGEYTKKLCEQQEQLKTPRELLISSFTSKETILTSGLVKWYLDHDLVITNIHWTLEYTPDLMFNKHVNLAADLRRKSDENPEKFGNVQNSVKVMTNSIYGKSGQRNDKFTRTLVATQKNVSRYIKNNRFRHVTPILPPEFAVECNGSVGSEINPIVCGGHVETELYKVEMLPRSVRHDLPIHISLFVLCESKETMLRFVYDVVNHYLKPNHYQILYMDTDSIMMSMSSDIDLIVKPGLEESFFKIKHKFFPIEWCDIHYDAYINTKLKKQEWVMESCCEKENMYAKRTPGLFKQEAKGTHFVGLCPKTYILYDEDNESSKLSTKSLNKSQNKIELDNFLGVLHTGKPDGGINHGFKRSKSGSVLSYTQYRAALSSVYCKRVVLSDGVRTRALDL